MTGARDLDKSGLVVSVAGDLNGDGLADIAVGAPYAGLHPDGGQGYVVFGSTQRFPPVFSLATLFPEGGGDGSRGFVLTAVRAHDELGSSLHSAGDINGDGLDDLVIGAPHDHSYPGSGQAYVIFGSNQPFPAVFLSRTCSPRPRRRRSGLRADRRHSHRLRLGTLYCQRRERGGDVNGDGIDDLIVGADDAAFDPITSA
jgi:hypothetical protein